MAFSLSGNLARQTLRTIAARSVERGNRVQVTTALQPSPRPSIYFLTPDYSEPSGGIRVIYRHVDILNAAGLDAFVLHQRPGFRCGWFDNQTRIANVRTAKVLLGDLLVVPEVCVEALAEVPRGIRYVIFNQNSHLTWARDLAGVGSAYAPSEDFFGAIVVSGHNKKVLEHAFPACPVRRIHLGIDPLLFHSRLGQRPRRIAYMPRRAADDARQVLQLLNSRGALAGWEVVPLDGLTHEQVANELRQSRVFI
jgi:hypothetical protein